MMSMSMPVYVRLFDVEYEIGEVDVPLIHGDIEVIVHEDVEPTSLNMDVDHVELRRRMAELLRSFANILEDLDAESPPAK